jgi:hypothetical protein
VLAVNRILTSSLLSAAIGALIWIVISAVTGASAAFAIVGGILCGVVIFAIQYPLRRVILKR